MAKNIVGVDIGANEIRAVEVSGAATSKPVVVRFGRIALAPGAAHRGEVNEPHTVATALKQLWREAKFRSTKIVLGVGNHSVLARDLALPKTPLSQIRESLPFHVQDLLPMPMADAVFDFYPLREGEREGQPVIQGILVAATKSKVMTTIDAARMAGLSPIGVDLIPFALTRLVSRVENTAGTTLLLDVGASTTTFVVAKDGVPQFVRLIGMGGADITSAISSRLSIEEGDADAAKRALGLPTTLADEQHRPAVEIIYEVAGELLTSIRNTITYVANTHQITHIDRIVLSGNGGRLPGLDRVLAEYTGISVLGLAPFATVARRGAARRADTSAEASLGVALGLALGAAA